MDEKRDTLADASEKLRLGILTAARGLAEFAKAVQQSKQNLKRNRR